MEQDNDFLSIEKQVFESIMRAYTPIVKRYAEALDNDTAYGGIWHTLDTHGNLIFPFAFLHIMREQMGVAEAQKQLAESQTQIAEQQKAIAERQEQIATRIEQGSNRTMALTKDIKILTWLIAFLTAATVALSLIMCFKK